MLFKKLFGPKFVPLDLQPVAGEIYGHIFENPVVGIRRDLYWNWSVDFQPIMLDGDEWDRSLAIEWLTWPIRRWCELDGMGLGKACHPELIECSLYLFAEHHQASLRLLELRKNGPETFEAEFSAVADVDDGSRQRLLDVSGRCKITFTNLIVVSSNLQPKPASALEAQAAVAEFIDLIDLKEPHSEEWRYLFKPKVERPLSTRKRGGGKSG